MSDTTQTEWLSTLRAIATIGVIGIHVSSYYVPVSGQISEQCFWTGNVYDSLSRFAVAIFVMLSGALLLDKEYPLKTFFRKRISRVVWPFLFWSCIYIGYNVSNEIDEGIHFTTFSLLREIFVNFRDGSSIHLWYVYMIIGLYLFIPIISKWIRVSTNKEIEYFLLLWVILMILDQPIIDKVKPDVDFRYFTGYLGYLVLGYYLRRLTIKNQQKTNRVGLALMLFGLLATIVGTWLAHEHTKQYVSTFYEPLSPNILLYSAGMFLFFQNRNKKIPVIQNVKEIISRNSYGIYLVHVLFLFNMEDYGIKWDLINPVIGIPITVVVCLMLSTSTIYILNKIPYLRTIIG